jgi:hypothetical protein
LKFPVHRDVYILWSHSYVNIHLRGHHGSSNTSSS